MDIRIANQSERERVFALRHEVFIEEQGVSPALERDEEDPRALHILAEEEGEVIGCARLILSDKDAHIGRLAVKKSARGRGVGADICRFIIAHCMSIGQSSVWLHSQCHARGFYERLGFVAEGEPFTEAGIDHVRMNYHNGTGLPVRRTTPDNRMQVTDK